MLDVTLPKLDGIRLCQRLRSRGYQMPILLLTARSSSHDKAIGQPLNLLLPDRFAERHRPHIATFGQSSCDARTMGERTEIFGRRKNGEEFPAEASISKLQLKEETIFTVILRDTSNRKIAGNAGKRFT